MGGAYAAVVEVVVDGGLEYKFICGPCCPAGGATPLESGCFELDAAECGTEKVNDDCRNRIFSDCSRLTTSRSVSFSCCAAAFFSSKAATLSSNCCQE